LEQHSDTAPPVSAPGQSLQHGGLDVLRLAGAFLVLLQHVTGAIVTAPGTPQPVFLFVNGLTWIAVPIFVGTSGYLYGRKVNSGDLHVGEWIWGRCRRILIPYVVWSLIYLGMRAAFRGGLDGLDWAQVVFGGGAFYTLWFLPMLLAVSVVTAALAQTRRALFVLAVVSGVIAVASAVLSALSWLSLPAVLSAPVGLCASVFVFSAAAWLGTGEPVRGITASYIGGALGMLITAVLAVLGSVRPQFGDARAIAVLAAQIAGPFAVRASLSWPVRSSARLRTVSSVSLGFYLVQGGVLNVFQRVLPTSALAPALWVSVTLFVVGGVTALICAGLYLVRPLRPLVA
jgi:surface polysaccharide O-acyltransferase-like enzyme